MTTHCFISSGINVGLAVGLSVGLLALIGVLQCFFMRVYCLYRRKKHSVRSRVVATNPSAGTTTLVTSNQTETSVAAPMPYPQEPVYKDTQFSSQEAPPSYADVTALPQAQVMALRVTNSIH